MSAADTTAAALTGDTMDDTPKTDASPPSADALPPSSPSITAPRVAHPSATLSVTSDKTVAVKSRGSIVAETIVDLGALGILGAELLYVRPAEWVQGLCVVGILLLAGVRVADLLALSRGLPARGGPAAIVIAAAGALASRLNGGA